MGSRQGWSSHHAQGIYKVQKLSFCLSRFPLILPILKPDYAVKKIMAAFHSNQQMLLMPRILYLFYFLQS